MFHQFYKGENFCNFLFAFPSKKGLTLKEKILLFFPFIVDHGEQIISFSVDPFLEGGKTFFTKLGMLREVFIEQPSMTQIPR